MKRIFSLLLVLALFACLIPAGTAESEQCIKLYLNVDPAAGYGWETEVSDPDVVTVDGEGFLSPDADDGSGVPLFTVMRLYGEAAGSAEITFRYVLAQEPDAEPGYVFTLPVTVSDTCTVSVCGRVQLPELTDPGYSWIPVQSNRSAVGLTQISDTAYSVESLANGTGLLYFVCANEDKTDTPCAFCYQAYSVSGGILLPEIWFTFQVPKGLIPAEREPVGADAPFAPEFLFDTTDLDGNPVTEQIFAGNTLTILNFWEPWCGPCVGEMPDLQKISQDYADRGVVILGIYSTPDAEDEVQAVLEATGVTYPILHYTADFNFLQTGYVPTTVVVNSTGAIVVQPFSSALPYEKWAQLIEGLL